MEIFGIQTGYNPMSQQRWPHRESNRIGGTSPVNVGKWERLLSLAVGGFLVYRAFKKGRWSSVLYGGPAVGLINRGLSGYCSLYNKMGYSSTVT